VSLRVSDLNGNLASFGVRPVLELLADSHKSGELRLTSGSVVGRSLFYGGQITYATTAPDGDTVRELEKLLARPLTEDGSTIDDVLREQLTEVFHDLLQFETGTFDFLESTSQSGADDQGFSVADVLIDADTRIEEWRKIRSVVPSTTEPYRVVPELPSGTTEVVLDGPSWRLIAAVGAGGSVEDAAMAMDHSEFRTAEMFAGLVGSSLLEPLSGPRPVEPSHEVEEQAPLEEPQLPEQFDGPDVSRLRPTTPAVTVSKEDLTREEMDEMIRNLGKGIFPNA